MDAFADAIGVSPRFTWRDGHDRHRGIEGIEATARLLREGLSLAEIRRVLLPESWQRALRACAAADVVTADLFDRCCGRTRSRSPPELTDLVEQRLSSR